MELFLMLVCYVLGAVIGYELVRFLHVLRLYRKVIKAAREVEKLINEYGEDKEEE